MMDDAAWGTVECDTMLTPLADDLLPAYRVLVENICELNQGVAELDRQMQAVREAFVVLDARLNLVESALA